VLHFVISAASGHLIEIITQIVTFYYNNKRRSTMRRLDMLKAKEILRLKHEVQLSLREIGPSL